MLIYGLSCSSSSCGSLPPGWLVDRFTAIGMLLHCITGIGKTGEQRMDAHAREAAGAAAGMSETYCYLPTPGDRVRCERPWSGQHATGTVVATNGVYVLVDMPTEDGLGERLAYYTHELEYVGPGN